MRGEKKIPLNPQRMNNASLSILADGAVRFNSSDNQGAGIFLSENILPWCEEQGLKFPVLVRIEVAVCAGQIYAQFLDPTLGKKVSQVSSSKPGDAQLYVYLEKPDPGAVLMIGVYNAPVSGEIGAIAIAPVDRMDRVEYKRIRAEMFPHWYYTCDLGDGVGRNATLADEKGATRAARTNLGIMQKMLDKVVPDLEGLRVLDVACSAGFHSFALARRGAVVTAIDWDVAAIEQAQFIQECVGGGFQSPITFRCTDLFALDAPPKSFDLIYCSGLFYHLADPIGAARKLATLCQRGAVIQSCVTAREGCLFELADPKKFPFCASWEFALVPSSEMVRKVFENAAFEVADMRDASEFCFDEDVVREQHPGPGFIRSGPVYLALRMPARPSQ